jgi:Putative auto-transporter adhesin, head GIN domain
MVNFKKLRQMIETKGNGKITTREISVSSFLRLHLSINGNIELIQSDEEKVVIETDENLQSYFDVVNSGKTLYVTGGNKLWIPVFTRLSIKIYCRQMNMLYNALHGNVFSGNQLISTDSFELKIHAQGDTKLNIKAPIVKINSACHGNVELTGECHEFTIKNASQGDLDCKGMLADITTLSNASQGDVKLYSKEEISIKHAGQGNVHYYGEGKLKNVVHHGQGEVKHKK